MGYVTVDFYKNTYQGNSIPDDILQGTLDKASTDVDTLTRMSIKKLGGFSQLSEFEKLRVQLAVCSQAEHIHLKSSLDGVASYSIGDISISMEKATNAYDTACIKYLNSTRLVNRGL